jgi:hypothetical protein
MVSCPPISNAYGVEIQLLRTFVAVARLGSFSAAAAELGYTQAAVSQQIAALESDLKTRLLSRRPVTPTETGARLLEHAEPILLRMAAARGRRHADDRDPGRGPGHRGDPAGGRGSRPRGGASRTPPPHAPAGHHRADAAPPAHRRGGSPRDPGPGPHRRPDRPGRPPPRAGPGHRRRPHPGRGEDRLPGRPPAGVQGHAPPTGSGRREMDSGRRRRPAAGRDTPLCRDRGLPGRLPLHGKRHADAPPAGGRGTRPDPAAGNGHRQDGYHRRPRNGAKAAPPHGAHPRGAARELSGRPPGGRPPPLRSPAPACRCWPGPAPGRCRRLPPRPCGPTPGW